MDDDRVLGADACRTGWIGIVLDGAGATTALYAPDLATLAGLAGPVAVIGVDIPIGLPDAGHRRADLLARRAAGPRWPSVFLTPVRAALAAVDHAEAVRITRERAQTGVSIQAFSLGPRIRDADSFARSGTHRVAEVHPELTFAQLAGGPLEVRKACWAGAELRRELLAAAGVRISGDLGAAGRHGAVDDVLDAAAAAWSARRIARGEAICRPDPPEVFSDGLPAAIWT